VALSDDERRVLAEIERDLVADDPKFAKSIERRRVRIPPAVWAVGIFGGLSCIVIGLVIAGAIGMATAVVGFVLIVANSWAALRSHRRRRPRPPRDPAV
jgi:lipid-A-disaccharide synthase-like uncharacterized protein